MSWTRGTRRWHRWLGLVVGVQLLFWIASGIWFVWTDLDEIHGDPWRTPEPQVSWSDTWVPPTAVDLGPAVDGKRPETVASVQAFDLLGRPHYRIRMSDGETVLADARTGAVRGPLDEGEAVALARASFAPDARVVDVERLDASDVGAHHEYRDRPLPAWRVRFDHDTDVHVYVSAAEARVVAHRNRGWRIFDALWMMHTMDWFGRDDFNNPWIRATSLAALVVAVSGYLLGWRTRRRRKRSVSGE